jgi:hypothetical protein
MKPAGIHSKARTHTGILHQNGKRLVVLLRHMSRAWVTKGRTYYSDTTGKIINNPSSNAWLDLDTVRKIDVFER